MFAFNALVLAQAASAELMPRALLACRKDDLDGLKELLEHASGSPRDELFAVSSVVQKTLLHVACELRRTTIVSCLLESGAGEGLMLRDKVREL